VCDPTSAWSLPAPSPPCRRSCSISSAAASISAVSRRTSSCKMSRTSWTWRAVHAVSPGRTARPPADRPPALLAPEPFAAVFFDGTVVFFANAGVFFADAGVFPTDPGVFVVRVVLVDGELLDAFFTAFSVVALAATFLGVATLLGGAAFAAGFLDPILVDVFFTDLRVVEVRVVAVFFVDAFAASLLIAFLAEALVAADLLATGFFATGFLTSALFPTCFAALAVAAVLVPDADF
jgi:hypothetical protein